MEKSLKGLLGKEVTSQPFYVAYKECWNLLHSHILRLQTSSNARTLEQLVDFVTGHRDPNGGTKNEILPTAALLTGINQPDHLKQFESLTHRLHAQQAARVCVLQSRDCATLKAAIESMVYNLMDVQSETRASEDVQDDEENKEGGEDVRERDCKRMRRSQCTIKQLASWYVNNFNAAGRQPPLVVIMPDFECFTVGVLQDFILILSAQCGRLPFVLILGVATAISTVHSTLPYHVSSKIRLRVFQTQAAPTGLNEVSIKDNRLCQLILLLQILFTLSATGSGFAFSQVRISLIRQGF